MIGLRKGDGNYGKKPSERTLDEKLRKGVFVLDKPCGPSSHEAAAFVRKILGLKKAGHSGTLDANVSGVLPVFLEEATKAVRYFLGERKKYVCIMRLNERKSAKEIEDAFSHFKGKIYQKPPLASAVAKKLRVREVFGLRVLEIDGKDVLFECDVEGGFYVRKLCADVGEVLGCGAAMLELRRTYAAGFTEAKAHSLQDLSDAFWLWKEVGNSKTLDEMVFNLEDVLHLKKVVVDDGALKPISTGANLAIPGIVEMDDSIEKGESVQVLSGKGEVICFAKALFSSKEIAEKERKGHGGLAFDIERVLL
ncbi:MAG: RNA-guided pseudouridylation complex pseudouridine synthase subunit Cbf5 [Candidatus Norongarragalinales archaeon]